MSCFIEDCNLSFAMLHAARIHMIIGYVESIA